MEVATESFKSTRSVMKEEEELGKFFDKLADLVPSAPCVCQHADAGLLADTIRPADETHALSGVRASLLDLTPSPSLCNCHLTSSSHDIGVNDPSKRFFNMSSLEGSQSYIHTPLDIHDTRTPTSAPPPPPPSVCCRRPQPYGKLADTTTTNIVLKRCRMRRRTAPYSVVRPDTTTQEDLDQKCTTRNSCRPLRSRRVRSDVSSSSAAEPDTEARLELLTDVIEYIHNLKSLLETAHGRGCDFDIESPRSSAAAVSSRIPSGASRLTGTSSQGSLIQTPLDRVSGTVPTGCVPGEPYLLEPSVPLDRAMELLEYKTGAITLTA